MLHKRLNTIIDKIKFDKQVNKLISYKDLESLKEWKNIIAMRSILTDSFKRLIISLYAYVLLRRQKDY